jgi:beta-phosphoglucomutase-like phosphatase (HAD superfamily)
LDKAFDFVASREDVEHGKPDPEIYLLVAQELGVQPSECLVVEDSPTGVKAALNAGMAVVAVSTPFTRQKLHEQGLLPESRMVEDPKEVEAAIARIFREVQKN